MQVIDKATQQIQDSQTAINSIESDVPHRIVSFSWFNTTGERTDFVFSQEELSFFGVQQFITLSTATIRELTQDKKDEHGNVVAPGLKISELFGGGNELQKQMANPDKFDAEQLEKTVQQNEQLITAFFNLMQIAPEYQLDVFCLSLAVPRHNREWVKLQLAESRGRGGLSLKDGADLLKTFIIQNAPVIRDFFEVQGKDLIDTFREHVLQEKPEDAETATVEGTAMEQGTLVSTGGMPSSTSSPATPESPSTMS